FDQDLDDRVTSAEKSVAEAQSMKDALPHIEPLVKHRADYHRAVADNATATEAVNTAWAEVERLRLAEKAARGELDNATTGKGEAEQAAAVAKDQHDQAIRRRDRFASTATKPVCSECGQPIDATHAAREQEKLNQAVKGAVATLKQRNAELAAASGKVT